MGEGVGTAERPGEEATKNTGRSCTRARGGTGRICIKLREEGHLIEMKMMLKISPFRAIPTASPSPTQCPHVMHKLMITCPTTQKPVFTGRIVRVRDYDQARIPGSAFRCPLCGEQHVWNKEMALAEPVPVARAVQSR